VTADVTHEVLTKIPRWTAPGAHDAGVGEHRTALPARLAGALRRVAADLGTDLPGVLLAAYARVLATVVAERDLHIGFVPAGGTAAAQPLTQPLPLRLAVDNSSWRELVTRTAATAAGTADAAGGTGAPDQESAPFEAVFDLSELESSPATGPQAELAQGAVLHVGVAGQGEALVLRIRFQRQALDEGYAERLAGYHLTALERLAADPEAPHHRQSLLSGAEVETQLYGLAGRRVELGDRMFVELFEERVRTGPDRLAAVHGKESWTYRELNARANRVAGALLRAGVQTEDVVAVVMDRNLDWVAAMLGVFKAGGVYLPVRPDFPADRVATQLERSACRFLLVEPLSEDLARQATAGLAYPAHLLLVPEIQASGVPAADPGVSVHRDQLAYIYFTSGSTGAPKGAMCEHAGMLNHLYVKIEDMGMAAGADEVVTQTASQCFDISLWQVAAPLLVGGAVRIVDTEVLLDVGGFV
jgi:non-ribosomal peptide synthetase component F